MLHSFYQSSKEADVPYFSSKDQDHQPSTPCYCKPILQFFNLNDVGTTMNICNNLGKPVTLEIISSWEVFHITESYVLLNTDGWQSFSFQCHPKSRVEFFMNVLGES